MDDGKKQERLSDLDILGKFTSPCLCQNALHYICTRARTMKLLTNFNFSNYSRVSYLLLNFSKRYVSMNADCVDNSRQFGCDGAGSKVASMDMSSI